MSRVRLLALGAAVALLALCLAFITTTQSTAAPAAAPALKLPATPTPAKLGLKPARSLAQTVTAARTFVSTTGLDTNPCTNAQPCRNFAAAIAKTTPGGDVIALTSGGYGPVSIGMSVSIIGAPGVHAAITAAVSGSAIDVVAGTSDTVVLRNLYLNGLGGGLAGIYYASGYTLHLEKITAVGFPGAGVWHKAPDGRLHGSDLVFRR